MYNNNRSIKAYYTANKEISDYKKTIEEAFIEYLRIYIKSKPTSKNNVFKGVVRFIVNLIFCELFNYVIC